MPYCEAVLPTLSAISPRLAMRMDFNGSIGSGPADVADVVLFHRRLRCRRTEALEPLSARTRATDDMELSDAAAFTICLD